MNCFKMQPVHCFFLVGRGPKGRALCDGGHDSYAPICVPDVQPVRGTPEGSETGKTYSVGWGGDGYNKYVEQLRARKQDKNIFCDRGREMHNQYVEHLRAQKQVST